VVTMASKITAHEVKYFIERKLEAMLPRSLKLNTSTSSLVAKQQLGVVRFLYLRLDHESGTVRKWWDGSYSAEERRTPMATN
jgi:hypothetical protein